MSISRGWMVIQRMLILIRDAAILYILMKKFQEMVSGGKKVA